MVAAVDSLDRWCQQTSRLVSLAMEGGWIVLQNATNLMLFYVRPSCTVVAKNMRLNTPNDKKLSSNAT